MVSLAPPSKFIRWGIIGCGDVTEVKSGPGFQKAHGSKLVAVMRRNGALAADYAKRHGVPRSYDNAQALVNDGEVDAVYIATPPGAHVEGALLAAAAGKPAYVEKPMARNTTECDAIIQAMSRAGQKLFVAYYRRALPRFVKVRDLLAGGAVGELTSVSYRMAQPLPPNADPKNGAWRLDAANSGGGLLLDVGSHTLDLLDYFVGPLDDVAGHAARSGGVGDVEDTVVMRFRTARGVPGAAAWNFAAADKEDMLEFIGSEGRISLSVFGAEPVRLQNSGGIELFDLPHPPHVAQPLIQTIVDELLGRGSCPSTGESARRTSAVMDRVLAGYYGGRDDAFWARPHTWPGKG
jgi:1,5-anhydro-D-fructose reductase (1,5-anhydro-D-mannitol-forming)